METDRLHDRRARFDAIPVLDIARFRGSGDPCDAPAREIDRALSNVGFFYLRGHGVPAALTAAAFDAARAFFALPAETKQAVHLARSGDALRGYTELAGENTAPGEAIDIKECFDVGLEYPGLAGPFQGTNQWPALAGFRPAVEAHLQAMATLGRTLLRAIAVSLDLEPEFFRPLMRRPIVIQRLLRYPAAADEIGAGAHTDYGLLTILAQDETGGLQVRNRDGEWIDAPPLPGTFVVNIADLMQRLTNDRYLANMHRVRNASGRDRYSLPCFVDCDADAVIAPLAAFTGPENPAAWPPVTAGAHKFARYRASYAHLDTAG